MELLGIMISTFIFSLGLTLLIYNQFDSPWSNQVSFEDHIESNRFDLTDIGLGISRSSVEENVEKPVETGIDHHYQMGDTFHRDVQATFKADKDWKGETQWTLRERNGNILVFDKLEDMREYLKGRKTVDRTIPVPHESENSKQPYGSSISDEVVGMKNEINAEIHESIERSIDRIKKKVESAKRNIKGNFREIKKKI